MGGRKEKKLNGREEREEMKWEGGKSKMGGRKKGKEMKWEAGKKRD